MTRFLVCISGYLLIKIDIFHTNHIVYKITNKLLASDLLITKLAMKGIIGYLLITLHFFAQREEKSAKIVRHLSLSDA